MSEAIANRLIKEFGLKPFQVHNTIKLIDEGNTIPFIARYRKEVTGELDDQVLRKLHERLVYLRTLEQRKEDVKRLIEEQGKLNDELIDSINNAETLQEIEDIYRPYKPKRRTRAAIAKEKGLESLAQYIINQENTKGNVEEYAKAFISTDKGVLTIEDAVSGALDIAAEIISDDFENRKLIREFYLNNGTVVSKSKTEEDTVYRMYYEFKEPVLKIASHRVLAINRGEREDVLSVSIEVPEEKVVDIIKRRTLKNKGVFSDYVEKAIRDAYSRLIHPSIENEIRSVMTERAEEQAIKVFSVNLRNLIMQPPVKGKTVLGLDPAYRTGCKLAVVDETGKVLDTGVIYPTPPQNKIEESERILIYLIEKHSVDIISIGNGTASKEAEIFVANAIKKLSKKVHYVVVSEAGASVYSASELGAKEFPDFDVSLRSAVSIARRLQDPLAELVKIDPKSIGVGQYQHDINQKSLSEALRGVVEDCVNSVGVDLNTASVSLLSYISGVNSAIAKNIVEYREKNGKFTSRSQLLKVKKLGEKTFEQCAGFLRIPDSDNILDNTSVHPESYDAAGKLIEIMGYTFDDVKNRKISDIKDKAKLTGLEKISAKLGIGVPTLSDIINELVKPGRDPRDELPQPVLLTDVLHIEDLKPGMILTGTVRNVADFGAFIDIGVHQDGLVHISEMSDKYVKNPSDFVAVGDIVKVRILDVDVKRKRISLSMKGV